MVTIDNPNPTILIIVFIALFVSLLLFTFLCRFCECKKTDVERERERQRENRSRHAYVNTVYLENVVPTAPVIRTAPVETNEDKHRESIRNGLPTYDEAVLEK